VDIRKDVVDFYRGVFISFEDDHGLMMGDPHIKWCYSFFVHEAIARRFGGMSTEMEFASCLNRQQ
jgi:hypothetical protein